jgi:hypothetical protein
MSADKPSVPPKGVLFSFDVWAVIIALLLALAVRFDLLKNIPW